MDRKHPLHGLVANRDPVVLSKEINRLRHMLKTVLYDQGHYTFDSWDENRKREVQASQKSDYKSRGRNRRFDDA